MDPSCHSATSTDSIFNDSIYGEESSDDEMLDEMDREAAMIFRCAALAVANTEGLLQSETCSSNDSAPYARTTDFLDDVVIVA